MKLQGAVIGYFHNCIAAGREANWDEEEMNWNDNGSGISKHLLDLLCGSCHFSSSSIFASERRWNLLGRRHAAVCVCVSGTIIREPLEGSESTVWGRGGSSLFKCVHVSPVNNQQGVKERSRIIGL